MLSRRGFFGVLAAAIAAPAAVKASVEQSVHVGVDWAAKPSRTVIWTSYPEDALGDWANDNYLRRIAERYGVAFEIAPAEIEVVGPQAIKLPSMVVATDLPVPRLLNVTIGDHELPADKPPSAQLLRKCNAEPPRHESQAAFVRRMMLPCPGRLE